MHEAGRAKYISPGVGLYRSRTPSQTLLGLQCYLWDSLGS